jgi:hypothetical protein
MTKQYYYKCPIKAAYMEKYFGVKFLPTTEPLPITKYVVSDKSNHIFEPKACDKDEDGYLYCEDSKGWIDTNNLDREPIKTSQTAFRDGKHFFMPESEEA